MATYTVHFIDYAKSQLLTADDEVSNISSDVCNFYIQRKLRSEGTDHLFHGLSDLLRFTESENVLYDSGKEEIVDQILDQIIAAEKMSSEQIVLIHCEEQISRRTLVLISDRDILPLQLTIVNDEIHS